MMLTRRTDNPSPDRSLRIALVHVADLGGGAERCVVDLHRTLQTLGQRSTLYVGRKASGEPDTIEIPRFRTWPGLMRTVYWAESHLGWQYLYAPWFRRLPDLLPRDLDVVHVHTLWGGQFGYADVGGLVGLSRRFPTVITLHDAWLMTGHCAAPVTCDRWRTGCGKCPDLNLAPRVSRDATSFNWRRKRRVLQGSNLVVTAVSHWLRDQAVQSPIFAGKHIKVIHNGVCAQTFQPGDRESARRRFGLPADRATVLLVTKGNVHVSAGLHNDAVRVLNSLREQRFTVVVIGPKAAELSRSLNGDAVCLGNLRSEPEMADAYRAADLTVVPSEYETFGRVAAESQMCGTPVIAYRTGGLTDVVHPDAGGELVAPRDANALREAILRWLDAPEGLTAKRELCFRWSRERFASPVIARQTVEVYREAIAARAPIHS